MTFFRFQLEAGVKMAPKSLTFSKIFRAFRLPGHSWNTSASPTLFLFIDLVQILLPKSMPFHEFACRLWAADGRHWRRQLLRSFYFPMRPLAGGRRPPRCVCIISNCNAFQFRKMSHLNPFCHTCIYFVFNVCASRCSFMARLWRA